MTSRAPGLNDLSISRTTIKWGIPLPVEGSHVFYVWFDALATYMSAVEGEHYWPADLHLIGKEIVRFHAIFWPAFLMAADLPLPKRIFAHGWLLFENDKMSKSRGNIVRATPIQQVLGADALRYFLLREVVFGKDGAFSYDALVTRYNSDLANGLGNLCSRTLSMIQQYRNGSIGEPVPFDFSETMNEYIDAFNKLDFSRALEVAWARIAWLDQYIVQQAPWKLAKQEDPESQRQLNAVLYISVESLRLLAVMLYPVLPETSVKIYTQLGLSTVLDSVRFENLIWGQLPELQKIGEITPLFMRIEAKPAIERMQQLEIEETARQRALFGAPPEQPETEPPAIAPVADPITIDDFVKVDLRVGQVKTAGYVKGADRLLHLTVDIGEPEPRTIVAGIAKAYEPATLVGRKVVIVANLAPRKLRGIESRGMIVAASLEGGSPVLAAFIEDVAVGARLK